MTAVDWALTREGLTPPKQLLLVALAWITDEDGVTFKSQATIAKRMGKDPRWVREHLPALADAGLLARYRRHRLNGSRTTDLIVLDVPRAEPVDLSVYDGIVGEIEPGDRPPSGGIPPGGLPAGSCSPSGGIPPGRSTPLGDTSTCTGSARARERTREPEDSIPDDFPDALRPHARHVMKVLREVAEHRGARRVTARAVAVVVMSNRHKPLVAAANACASWIYDRPEEPCKDVLARYRRWLTREPELQGVERLAEDGTPAAPGPRGIVSGSRPAPRDARREGKEWATRRRMALMQGMSEQEAQAFASSSEPIAALHAVPSIG